MATIEIKLTESQAAAVASKAASSEHFDLNNLTPSQLQALRQPQAGGVGGTQPPTANQPAFAPGITSASYAANPIPDDVAKRIGDRFVKRVQKEEDDAAFQQQYGHHFEKSVEQEAFEKSQKVGRQREVQSLMDQNDPEYQRQQAEKAERDSDREYRDKIRAEQQVEREEAAAERKRQRDDEKKARAERAVAAGTPEAVAQQQASKAQFDADVKAHRESIDPEFRQKNLDKEAKTEAADKKKDLGKTFAQIQGATGAAQAAASGDTKGALGSAAMLLGPEVGVPVQAALAVADIIQKKFGDAVRSIGDVAEGVAKPTQQMASGNNAQALFSVGDGMVSLAKELPIVGEALGVVGDTAMRVSHAFVDTVNSFVDRGRELQAYSGGLSASYSASEVKNLQADIKEANRLDQAGLSQLNDATTDISIQLRDMLLPIKEFIVQHLAEYLKNFDGHLRSTRNTLAAWDKVVETSEEFFSNGYSDVMDGNFDKLLDKLTGLPQKLIDEWRNTAAKEKYEHNRVVTDALLRGLANAAGEGLFAQGMPAAIPELGIPLIKDQNRGG